MVSVYCVDCVKNLTPTFSSRYRELFSGRVPFWLNSLLKKIIPPKESIEKASIPRNCAPSVPSMTLPVLQVRIKLNSRPSRSWRWQMSCPLSRLVMDTVVRLSRLVACHRQQEQEYTLHYTYTARYGRGRLLRLVNRSRAVATSHKAGAIVIMTKCLLYQEIRAAAELRRLCSTAVHASSTYSTRYNPSRRTGQQGVGSVNYCVPSGNMK